MTSAAFAMPDDRRQRVSVRRRSTNSATATSQAADDALQYVLDRRLRKREGRLPPPRRGDGAGPAEAIRESLERFGLPMWLLRVGLLAGVAVVLGGAIVTLAGAGSASHSVAGTLLVGKAPLAGATISFHRASGDGFEPVTLTTGQGGTFASPDERPLPAGLYAIVVDGVPGGHPRRAAVVPAEYRDPATTPLRVLVTENLSGLRLMVRR
jgi:hypothetical protein